MGAETRIIISARDLASKQFAGVGKSVDGLIGRLTSLDGVLSGLGAGLGAGLGIGAALQGFGEYEDALTDMGKVTDESLAAIDTKIGELPDVLGTSTELVRGYYQVISAGVKDPARAMDLLTESAMDAKSAHVEQSSVVKGLTKLMAGFSGEIASAADASDLLFSIEKEGQTNFAELVPIIGDIASISHQAGVSAEEMGAGMALISQTAGGTSQAATQYKAILMGLIKPQEQMRDLLKSMGYASGTALVQQNGLSGALLLLTQSASAAGIPLGKLFESSEALTALGPLLADNFGKFSDALKEMENRAGRADKAFQEWQKTQAAAEERAKNTVKNFAIGMGEAISPAYTKSLNEFSTWLDDLDVETLAGDLTGLAEDVVAVGSNVGSLLSQALEGWNALPDVIKEFGLLGALFGGAKGKLLLLAITELAGPIANLWKALTLVDQGKMQLFDLAFMNADELKEYLAGFNELVEVENQLEIIKSQSRSLYAEDNARTDAEIARLEKKRDALLAVAEAERMSAYNADEQNFFTLDRKLDGRLGRPAPIAITTDNGGGDGGAAAKAAEDYIDKAMKEADKQLADLLEKQADLRKEFGEQYRKLVLGERDYELEKLRETADAYIAAGSDKVAVETWVASETARINEEKLRDSRDAFDGMAVAFQDYADEATNAASQMGDMIDDAMRGVEDALVAPFEGAKFEIGNLVNAILSDIMRIGIRTSITGPLSSMLGDVFSGVFHEGGVVGQGAPGYRSVPSSAWAGAPRYHSGGVGGLAPDELAVIVRRGEEILTEDDPRHRNNLPATRSVPVGPSLGVAQPSAAPKITLNIHNETGQNIAAQDVDVRFDGEGFVVTAWMRAVRENRNGVRDFLRGGGAN